MPKIQQLSPHVADLIAAGEVVERPASAAKELVENAIDAGAKKIVVELKNGGMTFLRVTDDGCGIPAEEAPTAFLRHATSKLSRPEDLEAIHTLGFRGEALAAISSVSRIDLLTRTAQAPLGISLHLEAGEVTESGEAGCPQGTTIIVRDLFYNTPARMKFMKRDAVEASALLSAVQRLAVAHPEVAVRVVRDGQEQLSTPGDGQLMSAIYAVLGRQTAQSMQPVDSHWENYRLSGYVSAPSATRGKRDQQLFFVNGRHVRSATLTTALEEAYRNQMMVGRFPSCVLHLHLPENLVDVNVHPAKTEVRFLREWDVFDCVCYGVRGALENRTSHVQMQLPQRPAAAAQRPILREPRQDFFRTMTAEDYRAVAQVMQEAGRPRQSRPAAEPTPVPHPASKTLTPPAARPIPPQPGVERCDSAVPEQQAAPTVKQEAHQAEAAPAPLLPQETPWRMVGEVFNTYIIVEQGRSMLLIDKHAAHERILFEKLRARQEPLMPQLLLTPILCQAEREQAALLLENEALLADYGFSVSDYGDGVLAISQIPAELTPEQAAQTLLELAGDIQTGRHAAPEAMRDTMLHTIACKAAIKGGWHSEPAELETLVREVLSRRDIQYCPHGRPVCIELTAAQLERQFKRA